MIISNETGKLQLICLHHSHSAGNTLWDALQEFFAQKPTKAFLQSSHVFTNVLCLLFLSCDVVKVGDYLEFYYMWTEPMNASHAFFYLAILVNGIQSAVVSSSDYGAGLMSCFV